MTTEKIRAQVQAGIDARTLDPEELAARRAELITLEAERLKRMTASMLGFDGTSLEDAVDAAYRPGGLSRAELRAGIEFRRAHPDQAYPGRAGAAA